MTTPYPVCGCECGPEAYKWMRCPYCGHRFPLTEKQVINNMYFKCPACKRSNVGSWDTEPDGTLIGRTSAGYKVWESTH